MAGQKAPSAKRCIKTGARSPTGSRSIGGVRKHRAPKGALRLRGVQSGVRGSKAVRKHRAPKGALRLGDTDTNAISVLIVRKHRAPKGALRRHFVVV